MTQLVLYDAALCAIAECHSVDEIKTIHDQAAALEAAARVAMNTEAERQMIEVRIRAERHGGELMRALQKADKSEAGAKGASAQGKQAPAAAAGASIYRRTIEKAGIPERTAQRWQELAEVPRERFEAHLQAEDKPSARAIIDSTKAKPQMSEEALWLWGRLRDFERMGLIDADPMALLEEMTESMRADVRRLAPLVASLMNRCTEKETV